MKSTIAVGCSLLVTPVFAQKNIIPDTQTKKMNIVFFLVDDMGYGDLGCTGNKVAETPNVDKFAANSTFFTSAYAAPESSPTRASILTGKYPARLHITTWITPTEQTAKAYKGNTYKGWIMPKESDGVDLSEYTLAEALKDNGYTTCHVGKWHIGSGDMVPKNQGFDFDPGFWPWAAPKSYFSPYGIPTLTDGPKGEYITDRLTDEAVKFIKSHNDKPFFLNFWHYAVHAPLKAKQKDIDYYLSKGAPAEGKDQATYSAMKHSMDESFGRIVQAIKEAGIEKSTIIVFFSDNGGVKKYADNGIYREGKKTLYEGGIRVPLIIDYPGVSTKGQVIDEPVSSIDFYPTLLEMAGIDRNKISQQFDGVSFTSLFNGKKINRNLFWHEMGAFGFGPASVIRKGDYKLFKYYGDKCNYELYNIKKDPSETTDLANKNTEIVAQLDKILTKWVVDVDAQLPTKN